ncbi:hypothetical protein MAR_019074 [Mya arenaria]|uniref:Secreted protein n=1 Tax=Mya arenaria TaxID=6604 RepID=A0ABY7EPL9_MYAAR|nr:hypothetical protein MAR_019074 [Mya arenaria]
MPMVNICIDLVIVMTKFVNDEMKTMVLAVAVLALCLIVAEARPPRKGKGGGGRRPRPLMRQAKFCKGLVNGNITNDDATFDAVFTDVTSVCGDLLQFLEDNKPVDESEGGEGEGEREEPTSVEKLLNFCDGVEKFEPTDNAPEGLQEILDEFQTPCDTARNLAGEDDGAEDEA